MNLFLWLMSWSLRPIGSNLGTAEKKMTRSMLNLLEQKNNYLIDGALQRKYVLIIQTLGSLCKLKSLKGA